MAYTNLGPGTYRLRVIAANEDGVWNAAGAAVDVVIPPPLAPRTGFRVLCAAAAGGALRLSGSGGSAGSRALRARFAVPLAERTRIAQELHDNAAVGCHRRHGATPRDRAPARGPRDVAATSGRGTRVTRVLPLDAAD